VLLARSQGVPVDAVGAIITHPLNSIIVRDDAGIGSPRDLQGKVVGQTGLPLERPLLETVVRADGGDPAAVRLRNVASTSHRAGGRPRRRVVGAYWNIELVDLERRASMRRRSASRTRRADYDELVLVTSDRVARERPELVRAMLAGLRTARLAAPIRPARWRIWSMPTPI